MKLRDKTAIVTGASHGVGRAIALLFAKEGANVVVNYDHAEQDARQVMQEIIALGRKAIVFKADVSKSDEVDVMVAAALSEFGQIDILVNNAGLTIRSRLWDLTEEKWDRVVDVNMKGTFLCSKAVAEVMVRLGGGKIVNIASMRAITGSDSSMHYAASKAGVIALTKSLAKELAPVVRVNAVAPGYVETRLHTDLTPEQRQAIIEATPLKRFGLPEDIAKAVLFFASDDSDYVTGQTLLVDGGRTMC